MTAGLPRGDLLALGWLCLVWFAVSLPGTGALRAVVALPAVLFLPGYALLGALFPPADAELSVVERAAFSVATSVAVGILLGIGLLASVGLTTTTAVVGVSAVVGSGVLLARHRRPRTGEWPRDGRTLAVLTGVLDDAGRPEGFGAAVAGLVVVAALTGAGGVAFLGAIHDQPGYTEFAVLPPDRDTPAAVDYRRAVAADRPLGVRVTNRHDSRARYAVAVIVERITGGEVAATRQLDRFTVTVLPGETARVDHRPSPPWPNQTRRLVYRLYRTDGGERRVADAHVWLNATGTATAPASAAPAGGDDRPRAVSPHALSGFGPGGVDTTAPSRDRQGGSG